MRSLAIPRRTITVAALVAVLLGLAGGCGPTPGGAPWTTTTGSEEPVQWTYVEVRRYVDHVGAEPGEVLERYVRGPHDEKIELLGMGGKTPGEMDAAELQAFDRLERLYEGGRGRYVLKMRDFALREPDLFTANYSWTIFSEPQTVAGRPCWVAEVKPRRLDRPWYRVWTDQVTQVVLRSQEFTPEGVLASTLEVLEIEYLPDLSQEEFPKPQHSPPLEIPLDQIPAFVPFEVFVPSYLPEGFELRSARISQKAGVPVLALSYFDGLQELFVVEYGQLTPDTPVDGVPVTVGVTTYGPCADAELALLGTQIHVTSKVEEGELMSVIEGLVSASP